ncbi:hypothetical protein ACFC4G_44380 [Streptomyces sp. NPDC056002]|uniref:hypothetical protein n=1 Tax=Streptomyces sp. NPDC056002 TaxID=3345675 RepID=UPI0035E0D50B
MTAPWIADRERATSRSPYACARLMPGLPCAHNGVQLALLATLLTEHGGPAPEAAAG